MEYLIYKLNKSKVVATNKFDADLIIWKPSICKVYHRRLPIKYAIWWIFHYFNIFGNKNLQIWLYYIKGELAHFFCIVPKFYRWPFMQKQDVQITYVVTEKIFQNKGLAFKGINNALSNLNISGNIWYVTDSTNIASQKLAEKLGFELIGLGKKKKFALGLLKFLSLK